MKFVMSLSCAFIKKILFERLAIQAEGYKDLGLRKNSSGDLKMGNNPEIGNMILLRVDLRFQRPLLSGISVLI